MNNGEPLCRNAAAIVLAGGASRRFGYEDKRFAEMGGQRLIDRMQSIASQQIAIVVMSLGFDPATDKDWRQQGAATVVRDPPPGGQGPLAGLAAGLAWIADHRPSVERVVTFPVDTPFLPEDYAARLTFGPDAIAIASWRGRRHFLCASWPVRCMSALAEFLRSGARRTEAFADAFGSYTVDFSDYARDPFVNVNTKDDLALADERLKG